MKTSTLLLSLSLSLVATGCIETKDVGVESDASSGGSSSDESGAPMTSGAGASETASTSGPTSDTVTASGTATTTATDSGTATEATQSGGDTGVVTMATATASDSDTDTAGGSESSSGSDTDGGGEQVLCEDSGGIWDVGSCGHYTCGLPPECAAVVPGCDCGVGSTFVEGADGGCGPSEECEVVAFACGPDLTCSAPTEFCDVLIPGVPGATTSYDCLDTPDSCSDAYTCGCVGGAGDCEKGPEGGLTVTIAAP